MTDDEVIGALHERISAGRATDQGITVPAAPAAQQALARAEEVIGLRHPRGQMWWWAEGDRYTLDLTFDDWFRAWLHGSLPPVPSFPELALDEESWHHPGE